MKAGSGIPPALRAYVLERDGEQCVWCGRWAAPGGSYSIQHRIPRGAGGTKRTPRACELVLLHGSATTGCHFLAESRRTWAKEVGLLVPRGEEPDAWPVLWRGHTPLLLTDDGWQEMPAWPEEVLT